MKSESKKYDRGLAPLVSFEEKKQPLKAWIFTYEIYRITSGITQKIDVGTKRVEAVSLEKAYESMKQENYKVVITFIYEL